MSLEKLTNVNAVSNLLIQCYWLVSYYSMNFNYASNYMYTVSSITTNNHLFFQLKFSVRQFETSLAYVDKTAALHGLWVLVNWHNVLPEGGTLSTETFRRSLSNVCTN